MTATIKSLSHESNASVYYDTGNKTKKQVDSVVQNVAGGI